MIMSAGRGRPNSAHVLFLLHHSAAQNAPETPPKRTPKRTGIYPARCPDHPCFTLVLPLFYPALPVGVGGSVVVLAGCERLCWRHMVCEGNRKREAVSTWLAGASEGQAMFYRPKAAAQLVGVGTSTLRSWSHMFTELLSPSAQPGPRERRYSEQDIGLFKRAKALLDGGATFEQARAQLVLELSAWPGSFTFRAGEGERVAALEAQIEALQTTLATKDELIIVLREQAQFYRSLSQELQEQLRRVTAALPPALAESRGRKR